MVDGLFPDDIVIAWSDFLEPAAALLPEEEAFVAGAIDKRRREFAKGRELAREALARFGLGHSMLAMGDAREPVWPAGIVGSITHSGSVCAAAVGREQRYAGIGIDAERAIPLKAEVARRVCSTVEAESFEAVPSEDRPFAPLLVFSAKESVYKCLFPVTRAFLAFDRVSVTLAAEEFRATLLGDAPPFGAGLVVTGRWRRLPDYVVTTAWLER